MWPWGIIFHAQSIQFCYSSSAECFWRRGSSCAYHNSAQKMVYRYILPVFSSKKYYHMEIVSMIFRNIAMFPTFFRSPMAPRRALEALRRFHAVGPSGHLRFHHHPVKRHETMRRLHARHGKSIGHGGYFLWFHGWKLMLWNHTYFQYLVNELTVCELENHHL